jgi:hypothetical protein
MILGCSESKDMNRIEQIVLRDANTTATLALPAAYRAKAFSTDGAQFRCQYPSMQPAASEMEAPELTVNVLLGKSKKSFAQITMEEAQSDHFDPERPGAIYRAGTKGEYKVFHRGKSTGDPKGFDSYYVFQAKDGQWVQVDDYSFRRQIGSNITVIYFFAKSKGTDFVHIDEVVTSFLKAHLKSQSMNHQGEL